MKNSWIYIALLTISTTLSAQQVRLHLDRAHGYMKPIYSPAAQMAIAGAANAMMDLTRNHYTSLKSHLHIPDHRDQFWNAEISWRNKWATHPDGQLIYPLRERYWQSSRMLVSTTDAWHMMKSIMLTGITTATFSYTWNLHRTTNRRHWYHYIIDAIILRAAFGAGFSMVYYSLKN